MGNDDVEWIIIVSWCRSKCDWMRVGGGMMM